MAPNLDHRSFKERFLGGAFWVAATQGVVQFLQFFATAILAHLLTPDDFGLVALCFVVTGTIAVFREMGLPQAVIQIRDLGKGHKNGAFWASTVIALFLIAAVFAGAGPLGALLGDSRVEPLLCVLAVGLLLNSLGLIPAALLSRVMDFRRLGFCDIGYVVGNAAVAVPLALNGYGVWSLVFGFLAGDMVRVFLAFYFVRWRPGLSFTKGDLGALLRFGGGITGSSFSYSLRTYVDKFLVGRFLGTAVLGGYNLAFRMMVAPQQRISWLVCRVTFAGFSSIQDEDEKIGRIYCKTLKLIALIAAPALIGLMICSDDFVALVYGPQWKFIVPPLRIMCVAGVFYAVGTTVGPVMMAKGRAGLFFKLSLIQTAMLTGAVLAGLKFGLTGVAVALTAQAICGYGLGFGLVIRLIKLRFMTFLGVFRAPLIAAAAVGVSAALTRAPFNGVGGPQRLLATVVAGLAAYLIALWLMRVPELEELKTYIGERLRIRKL